jgi:hypothetical protein
VDDIDKAMKKIADGEAELKEAVLKRLRDGGRGTQAELARRTGKSREYFRLLARENGL